ncbi:glutamine--fructose-6-phosphate transaminase (isomerizing) [Candidatus Woesearchaeota archaeon]|nr:glutamine--fructose-6-phosphate transaminase (isomerizing) [Candidatus Woesearchaeota archaeon]
MCGIIGYIGKKNASKIVVEGLKMLEYRGYDSWGVAFKDKDKIDIIKKVGQISKFTQELPESNIAMGHTRWATHGRVNETNAHPHTNSDKSVAVVHNGIIENYQELRKELKDKGYKLITETDTEVIPFLITEHMKKSGFTEAVRSTLLELQGNYAIAAINKKDGIMIGARKGSPLILGVGDGENFIASDAPAFMQHTRKVVFLEEGEMAVLNGGYKILNVETGAEKEKEISELTWSIEKAMKGKFPHFMLKEIHEQPESLLRTMKAGNGEIKKAAEMINKGFGIFLVACGTAYHSCLSGSYLFSEISHKHVNHTIASEFKYYEDFLTDKTLMVPVSQSGETADLLDAVRSGKKKKVKILPIVNVLGSTLARMGDDIVYLNAGPEIGVASTKAYTSQVAVMILLAHAINGDLEIGKQRIREASDAIKEFLKSDGTEKIQKIAKEIKDKRSIFTLGRGLSYPTALEAALKIKEISYIHAEGFPGGELKHGTIALIEKGTPCIVFVPENETKMEILSNAGEVKARGASIIGVGPENNEIFDYHIKVPDIKEAHVLVNIVPMQLLAYHLALLRGCDPDKPRNLAKSVTVK